MSPASGVATVRCWARSRRRLHPGRLEVAPGDILVMYTDGLVERRDRTSKPA